ncbi:unnamed protein product [Camellia sinensis]
MHTIAPLKSLKPSRSSTMRVFAAPELLDSQETLDGPDSATTEMAPKQKIRIKLRSYWVRLIEDSCKQITDAARTTSARPWVLCRYQPRSKFIVYLNLHMSTKMPGSILRSELISASLIFYT